MPAKLLGVLASCLKPLALITLHENLHGDGLWTGVFTGRAAHGGSPVVFSTITAILIAGIIVAIAIAEPLASRWSVVMAKTNRASSSIRRAQSWRRSVPQEADVTDDPPPDEVTGTQARPSARTRAQLADGPHLAPPNGARPSRRATATKKTGPTNNPAPTRSEESATLVLRSETPPTDKLDFDDRHDTRATESNEAAQRYRDLRKDRRRDDWHKLAMSLVGLTFLVAVYLAGFIVVSRLLPNLGPWLVAKIIGLPFVVAGGGVVARLAGRVFRQRSVHPTGRRL